MRLLLAVVAGVGLLPAVAAADPGQSHTPVLSATITPLAVPWEIFELTRPNLYAIVAASLELRAHPNVGCAVMGLAGDGTDTFMTETSHYTFVELGLEPRWYPRGGFRGQMLGAALHYFRLHQDVTDTFGFDESFAFAGYTYGPFYGYKYTFEEGFTIEAKVGIEGIYRTMSDAGSHPHILPITDLKIGWSF